MRAICDITAYMSKTLVKTRVDRLAAKPIYQQVEDLIEQFIRQEGLKANDAIPSIQTLSKCLGINHLTIRKAIRNLVERNVLITRQGRGTFVAGSFQLKKILWVCGQDIFSGDISPYYTDMLRFGKEQCAGYGLTIEPIWLDSNDVETAEHYCRTDVISKYAGFIFTSCKPFHPLLMYVKRNGLNYVNITSEPSQARRVSDGYPQAVQLGLEYLTNRGHQKITIVCIEGMREAVEKVARGFSFEYSIITFGAFSKIVEYEREGYRLIQELLINRKLGDGVLFMDDIVARGGTRAILEYGAKKAGPPDIVVRCGRQEMIPLGIPVVFVVHDTQEMIRQALRILVNQIEGYSSEPDFYVSTYQLVFEDNQRLRPNNYSKKDRTMEAV